MQGQLGMFRPAGVQPGQHSADVRTFPVELNAATEHGGVAFIQAGREAMFAFGCAGIQLTDDVFILLVHVLECIASVL